MPYTYQYNDKYSPTANMIMTWNPRNYLESLFEKCIERTLAGKPWNHREVAISRFFSCFPFLFWQIPAYHCLWIYELSCLLARDHGSVPEEDEQPFKFAKSTWFRSGKGWKWKLLVIYCIKAQPCIVAFEFIKYHTRWCHEHGQVVIK